MGTPVFSSFSILDSFPRDARISLCSRTVAQESARRCRVSGLLTIAFGDGLNLGNAALARLVLQAEELRRGEAGVR